jgi:hypothetical protein
MRETTSPSFALIQENDAMWNKVVEKLNTLKSLDRQCQAFGAEEHRYVLYPCASADELTTVEQRLSAKLPFELRAFYTEVGNGVAGPYYGLLQAGQLSGYRPGEDYPGVDFYIRVATEDGGGPDERGYFEVSHEELAGLLTVMHEGCGHEVCLVTSGPETGKVVYVSADGYIVEKRRNLIDAYHLWLDGEIERFEAVREMMAAGKSYEEINARFRDHGAGDLISSIADVPKPPELFGAGSHKIYHGATQSPWYKSVLEQWQRRNA